MTARDLSVGSARLGILGDAGRVAAGVAAGQALILAATPILSRLYDPDTFGVFAVLTSIESILIVAAALRIEQAIPLPSRDEDGFNLAVAAIGALVLFVVLATVGAMIMGPSIAEWTDAPAVERYLILVPAILLFDGVFMIASFWAVRMRTFGTLSGARISQGASQSVSQVGLGFVVPTAVGLMGGVGIGRLTASTVLVVRARGRLRSLSSALGSRAMWKVVSRYRRFPLIGTPAALVNSAGLQLPGLLVAGLYGPAAAGFFLLATRMVALPISTLGQAAAQSYLGHAAKLARESMHSVRGETRRLALRLVAIGIGPTVLLAVAGPGAFGVILGTDWTQAGEYVRILAPMFLAQFVVIPLAPALAIAERQDVQLGWDVARLLVVVSAFVVPGLLGWSVYAALAWFTVGGTLMYVVLLCLILGVLAREPRT